MLALKQSALKREGSNTMHLTAVQQAPGVQYIKAFVNEVEDLDAKSLRDRYQ